MKPAGTVGLLGAMLLLAMAATTSAGDGRPFVARDAQSFIVQDGAGSTLLERQFDNAAPAIIERGAAGGPISRDGVLWTVSYTDAMYTSCAVALPGGRAAGRLVAGTTLNPPKQFELYPIFGDGTPDWVFPGEQFYVAAAREADVVAGLDVRSAAQEATLYRWDPAADSNEPLWSYNFTTVGVSDQKSLAVSDDGSTIAVLATFQSNPSQARLYYFDANSPAPKTYDPPAATFSRALSISRTGRYVAVYAAASVYVYDTVLEKQLFSGSAVGSNDVVGISGSGAYLAYGWTTLFVRRWNEAQQTYEPLWTRPGGGMVLGDVRISADDSTLAVGLYPGTFDSNLLEIYALPSSTPLWTYTYPRGSGAYQDVPSDVCLSRDGAWIAMSTWGDQADTNPELHVWRRASSQPFLKVDTPGSMFDADLATTPSGIVVVSTCGKHIHANEHGRGGDLYSVAIVSQAPGDLNCDGLVDFGDINPFVLALGDPEEYQRQYPGCDIKNGDIDGDGSVNFGDINLFVELLSGL